ncbi:hypothetical protein D0X99_06875 [Algoriphagus lacus]|uniref:DUF4292 domain-containing protein n=1 Tax=Algoriphagus lacus TaxID=2056311 RepID=A0A418PVA1_9BACT|nr:DUF6503 family protein [Algoriphagus lacus]RIW17443.1 hypothetical protein D0X99_06875 [Algoriphagus lacus]
MRFPVTSILLCLLVFAFSCEQKPTTPDPRLNQPEEFKKLLDAHGDWSKWINAKGFSYAMVHETTLEWENHYISLPDHKVRIDADKFQIGNDGEKVWISPNRQAFSGQSVQFYHNLYFSFFSLPYILTDPGVTVKKSENRMLNGQSFETLEATIAEGTGPSNKFYLLKDPETGKLAWALYSITFFNKGNTALNAIKFEDYRDADGLFFPRVMTGYQLENDSTTVLTFQVSFSDVFVMEDPLEEDLFKMPKEKAVVAN